MKTNCTNKNANENRVIIALGVLWAFPWTLLGLIVGLSGLCTGGRCRNLGRAVGFHGGVLRAIMRCAPIAGGAAAITLGHVILARSAGDLESTRQHELVHVRQYERWGVLFVPAYLLCSAFLLATRHDAYRNNPFERQAYDVSNPRKGR